MGDSLASGAGAVLSGDPAHAFSADGEGERYTYLPWVDLICAGVPCQDVSVAGKRAGLHGERTGLFFDFARLLRELRPTWFVFENVPGLLSSNAGRDFAEVLRVLMVECGYGVCWRVLDSRFFNVAQRRERVFIVGRFGRPCPAAVLFDAPRGLRDVATTRAVGEDIAATLTSGIGITGNAPGRRREDDINLVTYWDGGQIADTLDSSMLGKQQAMPDKRRFAAIVFESRFLRNGRGAPDTISPPLKAENGGTGKGDGAPLVCTEIHPAGMRELAGLPKGLDSARYRALGNAVTTKIAEWIGRRILEAETVSNPDTSGQGPA